MLNYWTTKNGTHTLWVDGQEWTAPDGVLAPELAAIVIDDLIANWRNLAGGHASGMHGGKVSRAENLHFAHGRLRFDIERHAGTMNGSTRAHLHTWEITPDGRGCDIVRETYRQLAARANSYTMKDARKSAFAVMRLLSGGRKNRGEMKVLDDGRVVIFAQRLVDLGQYKRTRIGRCIQFLKALEDVVETRGWRVVMANPKESTKITLEKSDG